MHNHAKPPAPPVAPKRGRVRTALASTYGRLSMMLGIVGLFLVGGTEASFATTTDGTDITGGAGDTFFSTLTDYFKGHVISSVLLLLALVVGVSMLISWGRKAAKKS